MNEKELREGIEKLLDSYFNTKTSHFSEAELACPCCGLNLVTPEMLEQAETIRALNGSKPMIVSSATRCARHNKEVGGVSNSLHLYGCAMDVHISGVAASTLVKQSKKLGSPDAYCINENWAHISVPKKGDN